MAARSRLLALCLTGSVTCSAHAAALGIGMRPTDAQIASWNIDVAPDGKGLPPGSGTVAEGRVLYEQQCAACHGKELEGAMGPALKGGNGTLASDMPIRTMGSYWPYATTLFDYTRRAMPLGAPQSLSVDEVYALVAYMLFRNGILADDTTVDAEVVKQIQMPNRDGFYVDDRPDTPSKPCYARCSDPPHARQPPRTSGS